MSLPPSIAPALALMNDLQSDSAQLAVAPLVVAPAILSSVAITAHQNPLSLMSHVRPTPAKPAARRSRRPTTTSAFNESPILIPSVRLVSSASEGSTPLPSPRPNATQSAAYAGIACSENPLATPVCNSSASLRDPPSAADPASREDMLNAPDLGSFSCSLIPSHSSRTYLAHQVVSHQYSICPRQPIPSLTGPPSNARPIRPPWISTGPASLPPMPWADGTRIEPQTHPDHALSLLPLLPSMSPRLS